MKAILDGGTPQQAKTGERFAIKPPLGLKELNKSTLACALTTFDCPTSTRFKRTLCLQLLFLDAKDCIIEHGKQHHILVPTLFLASRPKRTFKFLDLIFCLSRLTRFFQEVSEFKSEAKKLPHCAATGAAGTCAEHVTGTLPSLRTRQ